MGSQAKSASSRNVEMDRLDGPAPIAAPEIGHAMMNLEAEVESLFAIGNALISRMDGVLRPEYARDSVGQREGGERELKAPISEHADRIALGIRAYRRVLENVLERLAL